MVLINRHINCSLSDKNSQKCAVHSVNAKHTDGVLIVVCCYVPLNSTHHMHLGTPEKVVDTARNSSR